MMYWTRRVGLWLAAVYLAVVATVTLFIAGFEPTRDLPRGATVVVLGGGQRADGTMGVMTAERLSAGLAVFRETNARRLVLTGGKLAHEQNTVADAMADSARLAGIPETQLVVEPRSLSTLQNALFSARMLGEDANGPIILVTHRFHLPRAWSSFHWAGMHDLTLLPADTPSGHWNRSGLERILYEGVKTPLNIARAAVFSLLGFLGVAPEATIRLLD